MNLAEFQQTIDEFFSRDNKHPPHWAHDGLTPHENFYDPKLVSSV
jgi:hypothetical protein